MTMRFRDTVLRVSLEEEKLSVTRVDDSTHLIWIGVGDTVHQTRAGQRHDFALPR
jgi:hypothetical protein